MKQYRLLKDLPGVNAGTIFKYEEKENRYYPDLETDINMQFNGSYLLQMNPDWFGEIKDYGSKLFAYQDWKTYPIIQLDYRDDIALILDGTEEKKISLSDITLIMKQ